MLGLPKTTEFNKRIPKQKFYDNLTITPALKKVFIDQIKTIYWRNKIAASTTNLAPGTAVTELEVFEVKLNSQILDDSFLRQIDDVVLPVRVVLDPEHVTQGHVDGRPVDLIQADVDDDVLLDEFDQLSVG